jgi:hypothetical protein
LGRVELYAFFHGIGFGDKFCEVVFMFTIKHVMLNLACIVLSDLSICYTFSFPKMEEE